MLLEASELAEKRAGDTGLAFEAMRRAFVLSPGDPRHAHVAGEMARLAEASGAWQELVAAYREAIERADAALAAGLRAKIGAALETHLDDARGALAAYLQVVSDTSDLDAGAAAVRVAGKLAEWDVGARVVVDLSRAKDATRPETLDAYERAADSAGAWDEAARALAEATSAGGVTGAAARDLEARLADWHRDRRGDPDAARARPRARAVARRRQRDAPGGAGPAAAPQPRAAAGRQLAALVARDGR